jgi:hypothetical protein
MLSRSCTSIFRAAPLLLAALVVCSIATPTLGDKGDKGDTRAGGSSPLVFGPYDSSSGPDSGICGNWATDTFTRTWIVTPRPDKSFDVTELEQGTFVTLAGKSPNDCNVTIPAGITGTFYADYVDNVASGADFNFTATCPRGCGLTDFYNTFFGGKVGDSAAWQAHYTAPHHGTWHNTDHGNSGNIVP